MPLKHLQPVRHWEYRLIWRYKGRKHNQQLLAQTPAPILRMLKRLATDTPWEGLTTQRLRKAWARLHMQLDVPWESVKDLKARDVVRQIRDAYPQLDVVRVEWRQVGQWTEMLDPMKNLRSPWTTASEHRMNALLDKLDTMSPEELDKWRLVPPNARQGSLTPTGVPNVRHSFTGARRLQNRQQRATAASPETEDQS